MQKSKFIEHQIAFVLKQTETGTAIEEVCRKVGVSGATFYNWKKKYGAWVFLNSGDSEIARYYLVSSETTFSEY